MGDCPGRAVALICRSGVRATECTNGPRDKENAVTTTSRGFSAGVASLDGPPTHGNYTIKRVDPVREPERYLRIRMAEFTCRMFGTALRRVRELRGTSRPDAEALIGLPPDSIAALEGGDACTSVQTWIRVWTWLGYRENVDAAACRGTSAWGHALTAFLNTIEEDADRNLVLASLGLDAGTLADMRRSSDLTEIHFWISAWSVMGILRRVVDAAYPSMAIIVAFAEAGAAALPEFDEDLARELGTVY